MHLSRFSILSLAGCALIGAVALSAALERAFERTTEAIDRLAAAIWDLGVLLLAYSFPSTAPDRQPLSFAPVEYRDGDLARTRSFTARRSARQNLHRAAPRNAGLASAGLAFG